MTKDSPDKALNKVEEENNLDATPAPEVKASEEVPKPKAEPTGEAKEKGKETGERPKKGYSQRVRELNAKAKEAEAKATRAEAKAQSLEGKLSELTAPQEPKFEKPVEPSEDKPILAPGEEIDPYQLEERLQAREKRILQRAKSDAELISKQSDAVNRINTEASEVVKRYPELDPESDTFNKDLSDSVTEAAEAHVRANPYSASVKTFVAKMMKPYRRAVTKEAGKVTEKVAKQASETALRPTSVKGGEKKFEELTIEEMEKKLGIVY